MSSKQRQLYSAIDAKDVTAFLDAFYSDSRPEDARLMYIRTDGSTTSFFRFAIKSGDKGIFDTCLSLYKKHFPEDIDTQVVHLEPLAFITESDSLYEHIIHSFRPLISDEIANRLLITATSGYVQGRLLSLLHAYYKPVEEWGKGPLSSWVTFQRNRDELINSAFRYRDNMEAPLAIIAHYPESLSEDHKRQLLNANIANDKKMPEFISKLVDLANQSLCDLDYSPKDIADSFNQSHSSWIGNSWLSVNVAGRLPNNLMSSICAATQYVEGIKLLPHLEEVFHKETLLNLLRESSDKMSSNNLYATRKRTLSDYPEHYHDFYTNLLVLKVSGEIGLTEEEFMSLSVEDIIPKIKSASTTTVRFTIESLIERTDIPSVAKFVKTKPHLKILLEQCDSPMTILPHVTIESHKAWLLSKISDTL